MGSPMVGRNQSRHSKNRRRETRHMDRHRPMMPVEVPAHKSEADDDTWVLVMVRSFPHAYSWDAPGDTCLHGTSWSGGAYPMHGGIPQRHIHSGMCAARTACSQARAAVQSGTGSPWEDARRGWTAVGDSSETPRRRVLVEGVECGQNPDDETWTTTVAREHAGGNGYPSASRRALVERVLVLSPFGLGDWSFFWLARCVAWACPA